MLSDDIHNELESGKTEIRLRGPISSMGDVDIWGDVKIIDFSGDGGYFNEFKKIGKEYGPFDIIFVENGQYDRAWHDLHMYPEEAVQAGIDSKSKILFPVHWGKYDLSVHPWTEPIERFTKEAKKMKQKIATPKIGEIFDLKNPPTSSWWS